MCSFLELRIPHAALIGLKVSYDAAVVGLKIPYNAPSLRRIEDSI